MKTFSFQSHLKLSKLCQITKVVLLPAFPLDTFLPHYVIDCVMKGIG